MQVYELEGGEGGGWGRKAVEEGGEGRVGGGKRREAGGGRGAGEGRRKMDGWMRVAEGHDKGRQAQRTGWEEEAIARKTHGILCLNNRIKALKTCKQRT